MAGLWETWRSPAGERIRSFTIITTKPNKLCAELHNRCVPALATARQYFRHLDGGSQVRIRLAAGAKWIRTLGPTLGIIVSRSLLSSRPVPLWESGNHHFANGEPKVRIHLPPPASQLRTWLPRSGCLTVLVPADRADRPPTVERVEHAPEEPRRGMDRTIDRRKSPRTLLIIIFDIAAAYRASERSWPSGARPRRS